MLKKIDDFLIDRVFQPYVDARTRVVGVSNSPYKIAAFFLSGFVVMTIGWLIASLYEGSFSIFYLLPLVWIYFIIKQFIRPAEILSKVQTDLSDMPNIIRVQQMFSRVLWLIFLLVQLPWYSFATLSATLAHGSVWLYMVGVYFMACNPTTINTSEPPPPSANPWAN